MLEELASGAATPLHLKSRQKPNLEPSKAQEIPDCERVVLPNSLRLYIREAWYVVEPSTTYLGNWHIDLIAEHIEEVTAGEIKRLLIDMPPRYAKSTSVSKSRLPKSVLTFWSLVSSAGFGHRSRSRWLGGSWRGSTLCLCVARRRTTRRPAGCLGPPAPGCAADLRASRGLQTHIGRMIDIEVSFLN